MARFPSTYDYELSSATNKSKNFFIVSGGMTFKLEMSLKAYVSKSTLDGIETWSSGKFTIIWSVFISIHSYLSESPITTDKARFAVIVLVIDVPAFPDIDVNINVLAVKIKWNMFLQELDN